MYYIKDFVRDMNIIDPLKVKDWNELVLTNNDYSFFCSSHWAKVLKESYDYSPKYFTSVANHKLDALIPFMEIDSFFTGRRGVSLPFTDFCDPIAYNKFMFDSFFKEITKYGENKKWGFIELRGGNGILEGKDSYVETYIHTLPLKGTDDEIFSSFKSNTRRNIRSAEKKGVKIESGNTMEMLENFYALNCLTRKRHGIPPQPISFYKNIFENVIKPGYGVIIQAEYENKVIASCIYFHLGKKAVYKYGASDKDDQNVRANNLIMWEAIKYYNQKGFDQLNFGRTDLDNDGLRRYKLSWGTTEELKKYYRFDLNKKRFITKGPDGGFNYKKILNKMPIPILKLIGKVAYRHVG